MDKLYDTPLKTIRKNCLECASQQPKEVRLCTCIDCPMYPYRFGKRPTKEILDTIKQFREENVEPTGGF